MFYMSYFVKGSSSMAWPMTFNLIVGICVLALMFLSMG